MLKNHNELLDLSLPRQRYIRSDLFSMFNKKKKIIIKMFPKIDCFIETMRLSRIYDMLTKLS